MVQDAINRALFDQQNYENIKHRIIWPDGTIRWVMETGKVFFNEEKKPIRMIGIVRDINDTVELESLLDDKKRRIASLMDISSEIIVMINNDKTVSHINTKGCEILGCPEGQIIGQNWFQNFLPPEDRDLIEKAFEDGIKRLGHLSEFMENSIINKKGDKIKIKWHNLVIRGENSNIIGTLSSGTIIP